METSTGATPKPPTDLKEVLDNEIKEWHFHIYFHQNNSGEHAAALALRDSVLRLRAQGAFVAVPLFRVNTMPMGPHPVGSYEIWCPFESFASVYSYLCMHRGELSILIHPLTRQQRTDHSARASWIGPSFPLDLGMLPTNSEDVPSQYHSLSKCTMHPLSWAICHPTQSNSSFGDIRTFSLDLTASTIQKLGYSSTGPKLSLDDRRKLGARVEEILEHEPDAAKAPRD